MEWLREFNWTIRHIEKSTTPTDQSERVEILTQFEKRSETNGTTKDTQTNIQLEPGHIPIKQKTKPKPYPFQNYVVEDINQLIKSRHLEKVKKADEYCFVSPVVNIVRKEKLFYIVLDSRTLTDSCIKMRPHMSNLEESLNHIPTEITRAPNEPLWISKIKLEYAYGQLKLADEPSKHCNFAITGGNMNG